MQMSHRPALGILALVLSWLTGTGALNLGLLKEGADGVAIPAFLTACALWLVAHGILKAQGGRVARMAALALIVFWILNLGFAAAVGKSSVYATAFFAISLTTTVLLLIFAGIVPMFRAKRQPSGR